MNYTVTESCVIILTDKGLQDLLKRYNCKTYDDLDQELWYTYGITLLDHRPCGMMTGVEAQNDPEFYDEGKTIEEYYGE